MSQEEFGGESEQTKNDVDVKVGLAQMLKGGVIFDVDSPAVAEIAQEAGAVAVMVTDSALLKNGAEIAADRMSDVGLIREIIAAVSIPVIAKVRVGHISEAQILAEIGVDFIDENEALPAADRENYISKEPFKIPFICGYRELDDALCRIGEGAAMVRTSINEGAINLSGTVGTVRTMFAAIKRLQSMSLDDLQRYAQGKSFPLELLQKTKQRGRLPVVNFAAGGLATPADAALMMQLGVDGVFMGSAVFKTVDPAVRARAIVEATTHFQNAHILAKVSEDFGKNG